MFVSIGIYCDRYCVLKNKINKLEVFNVEKIAHITNGSERFGRTGLGTVLLSHNTSGTINYNLKLNIPQSLPNTA